MTEKGADEHIDALDLGRDHYPYRRSGEVRATVKVVPETGRSLG